MQGKNISPLISLLTAPIVAMAACGGSGSSGDGESPDATAGDTGTSADGADGITPPPDGDGSTSDSIVPSDEACPRPTKSDPDIGQALPKLYIDTTYAPGTGKTIAVKSGDDLQKAIDAAAPGDTIAIDPSGTFKGPITLPKKTGDAWITIRSSAADGTELPRPGQRATPSHAKSMPKITAPAAQPGIQTAVGAHHYRFVGLEVRPVDESVTIYQLVELGSGSEKTLDQLPHDIVLDRMYVHGYAKSSVKRCVQMNSGAAALIDSWLADCHVVGQDAQAVGGFNAAGPIKIVNNHLEGSGENVLFGGADPAITDLVPADFEIARNHIIKPLSWREGDPSYAGTHWSIKNLFELKNARRALFQCNVLEHSWGDAQNGYAILFTPRNQDGGCPGCGVQDVTLQYNLVIGAASGFDVLGTDDNHPSQPLERVVVSHNVLSDIDGKKWNGSGWGIVMLGGDLVKFDHDTFLQTSTLIASDGAPATKFFFTSNIAPHNAYGIFGSGTGIGNAAIAKYLPASTIVRNVIAELPSGVTESQYPADNFFPKTLAEVFADPSKGDYHVAAGSPYAGKGLDGKDVGADIDAIAKRTAGVVVSP
jgi:hypothetical protein